MSVLLGCIYTTVQGSSWADGKQFTAACRTGAELRKTFCSLCSEQVQWRRLALAAPALTTLSLQRWGRDTLRLPGLLGPRVGCR